MTIRATQESAAPEKQGGAVASSGLESVCHDQKLTSQCMTDKEALEIARGFEMPVAWPTVIIAVLAATGYWVTAYSCASGLLPWWIALPLNVTLSFAAYTPLHEACHGNVAPGSRRLGWLNTLTGIVAAGPHLHNFHMHQISHLAHHAHTNDPKRDPDHAMASKCVMGVLLRGWTMAIVHPVWGVRLCRRRADGHRRLMLGGLQMALWISLVCVLMIGYNPALTLTSTVLASWLGSALLGVTFDWMPHHPHLSRNRWSHTRTFTYSAPVQGALDVILLGQTYHLVHHLYPRVPFYKYKAVFGRLGAFFQAKGAPMLRAGGRAGTHRNIDVRFDQPSSLRRRN